MASVSAAPDNKNSPTMVLPAVTHGFVAPMYLVDNRRTTGHQPGKLLYSAQFDNEKLKCLYMCLTFPFCCGLDEMAQNTSYDVYTNAVVLTRPSFWPNSCDCLCGRQAWGLTRYYDNTVFDSTVTHDRICNPNCYALVGWCGKFGEQINHHNVGLNSCCPSSLGHVTIPACCQTIESVYGLSDDEARRVATIINDHARIFRESKGHPVVDPVVQAAMGATR